MNAKNNAVIDRFIELRAQGWTFVRIATELGVSKPTLISWSRQYVHRIQNLQALETEVLSEQSKLSRRACLENLGEDARRIREEIARRDLSDIPTARLIALSALLRAEAGRLNGPLHLSEPFTEVAAREEQIPDPAITWEV